MAVSPSLYRRTSATHHSGECLPIVFWLQENVSCLNTTLVFLMFAHKKGQLARYLRALSDRCATSDVTGSGNILRNFRSVVCPPLLLSPWSPLFTSVRCVTCITSVRCVTCITCVIYRWNGHDPVSLYCMSDWRFG